MTLGTIDSIMKRPVRPAFERCAPFFRKLFRFTVFEYLILLPLYPVLKLSIFCSGLCELFIEFCEFLVLQRKLVLKERETLQKDDV